jgi:serine/threonine-protein kinase
MILAHRETLQTEARFRKEAETVARLRHPNIVQVFEVGQQNGCSFLSMEFVDGKSLDLELAQSPLSVRHAAKLVETLASAMHYAHTQGIIHRDLKPANVLMTSEGAPKITDFGLAKLRTTISTSEGGLARLDTDGGANSLTLTGQVLGTPCYMAPEQAGSSSEVVGPATDVYALGAILYEALCGRTPFRGETALDTLDLVRLQDPVPPRQLQPRVPRDLETICLKCLSKEPRKRYATAERLADDLRRFLGGEPIAARPIRWWERTAKWTRRRPAVAALVAVIAVGLVGITLQWLRAESSRVAAVRAARKAVAARNWAIREQQRAEVNFEDARKTIERLTQLGQQIAQRPQMQKTGNAVLEEALNYYEDLLDQKGSDPKIRFETGRAAMSAGAIQAQLGQRDKSEQSYRQAIKLLESLASQYPDQEAYLYQLASAQVNLAHLLRATGRTNQAEEMYDEMIKHMNHLLLEAPDDADFRLLLAMGLLNRCAVLSSQDWDAHWERDLDQAIELQESVLSAGQGQEAARSDLAMSLECLGDLMLRTQQLERAEDLLRQSLRIRQQMVEGTEQLGLQHHYLARGQHKLAHTLHLRGHYPDAEEQLRESIRTSEALVESYPDLVAYNDVLVNSYAELAEIKQATDQVGAAILNYEQCAMLYDRLAADFPSEVEYRRQNAKYLLKLGTLYKKARRSADAEKAYRKAIKLLERLSAEFAKEHAYQRDLATSLWHLAYLLRDLQRLAEAEASHRQALVIRERLATEFANDPGLRSSLAVSQRSLGGLLDRTGRSEEAAELLRKSIQQYVMLTEEFPSNSTYRKELAETYDRLAQLLKGSGKEHEAGQAFRLAVEHDAEETGNNFAWFLLTCADESLRDTQQAMTLAKQAAERTPQNPNIRSTLGVAYFRCRDWQAARDELQQAVRLRGQPHGAECIVLAMTHWHLGQRDQARDWYQKGVAWLPAHQDDVDYADVARLRAEAEGLLAQEATDDDRHE